MNTQNEGQSNSTLEFPNNTYPMGCSQISATYAFMVGRTNNNFKTVMLLVACSNYAYQPVFHQV